MRYEGRDPAREAGAEQEGVMTLIEKVEKVTKDAQCHKDVLKLNRSKSVSVSSDDCAEFAATLEVRPSAQEGEYLSPDVLNSEGVANQCVHEANRILPG